MSSLDLLSVSLGSECPKFLSDKLSLPQVQVTTDKRLKLVLVSQISTPRHTSGSKNMTGENNGRYKNNSQVRLFRRNYANCIYMLRCLVRINGRKTVSHRCKVLKTENRNGFTKLCN